MLAFMKPYGLSLAPLPSLISGTMPSRLTRSTGSTRRGVTAGITAGAAGGAGLVTADGAGRFVAAAGRGGYGEVVATSTGSRAGGARAAEGAISRTSSAVNTPFL